MANAYLLVKVRPGEGLHVAGSIRRLPEVRDVKVVFGDYDLIVEVEAGSPERLDEIVSDVRGLGAVENVVTLLTFEPRSQVFTRR